jgi:hypothetical protein
LCGCSFFEDCATSCPTLGLPICDDTGRCQEAEGSCRDTGECGNLGLCVHPDDQPGCGIPPPDFPDECASNDDCDDDGTVCDFVDDGCGGAHLGCVARCDGVGGACVDGEACVEGRCEAVACSAVDLDDAFVCAPHLLCSGDDLDPLSDDRHHGCVFISCDDDAGCLSDFCVNGRCAPTPGTCELPRP